MGTDFYLFYYFFKVIFKFENSRNYWIGSWFIELYCTFQKVEGRVKLPKEVKVRMSMKISPDSSSTSAASQIPSGQTLISSTTGTLIKNGVTTIHETSVIGTTIEGQYAQFVKSTSRILAQDVPVEPTAVSGSVEAVTELPLVNALPQAELPEKVIDQQTESSVQHSSVHLEPSFQFTTGDEDATENLSESTTAATERISGLVSSQRRRNDDNRWRYLFNRVH